MQSMILFRMMMIILFFLTFSVFNAYSQPCVPNTNSIDFNGTNSFVRINTLNGLEITDQLTIEAWINPKGFATSTTGNSILCKHSWGSSMFGYVLRCGGSGQLSFNIGGAVGGSPVGWQEALSNPGSLVLNTWQHVAGTFDGNVLTLYIDGVVAGNTSFTGTIHPSTGYKARIGALADTVWGMSRYFNGLIDEVRVWNRALSPTEIVSGMNDHIDPAGQTGLVGYWRLNEGAGTMVNDLGNGNNNGTLVNGTWSAQVPFNNTSIPIPTISWASPNLVSSYSTGNQWYFGINIIPGATQQTYTPTQYGYYKVAVTDTNGCTAVSVPFYYNTTGIAEGAANSISVFPNPARDRIYINDLDDKGTVRYMINNVLGQKATQEGWINFSNNSVDISRLKAGIYNIKIFGPDVLCIQKLIIE
jgi:hypothetical protein